MGKQLNYYMDYDSFLSVAQKAVDLGCTIVKEDLALGKVTESSDISIVTPHRKPCNVEYYFHVLDAGSINTYMMSGKERLEHGFCSGGNSIIEAGYSLIINEKTGICGTKPKKEIRRARIYCITGYYDENGNYIQRPECVTKVYNSIARYVKKIAPYTELTDVRIGIRDDEYGKEIKYNHKEYITKFCLDMRNNEGYKLF